MSAPLSSATIGPHRDNVTIAVHLRHHLPLIMQCYHNLCAHCDALFQQVAHTYGTQMPCRALCDGCCTLETVCAIEAVSLASAAHVGGGVLPCRRSRSDERCPLLHHGRCKLYDARPLICRTHGLPLRRGKRLYRSCPLTFPHTVLRYIDTSFVLDDTATTTLLARLNIALCMAAGAPDMTLARFRIYDAARGKLPQPLAALSRMSSPV